MRFGRTDRSRGAKVWNLSMYPTNTLTEPPTGNIVSVGGGAAALAATVSIGAPRGGRRGGKPVGADAEAETGPYAIVTEASGTGARRTLAEQLFATQYPKLAGWVRRLVDDDETAHEIASEAFVRLLSKWTSLNKVDSPQSYLYMIATNLGQERNGTRGPSPKPAAATAPEPSSAPSQDVDIGELLDPLPARLREP